VIRKVLLVVVASFAVFVAAPAGAEAGTISLGSGLGLTYSNGPVLTVTTLPSGEVQLLLADATSTTCAASLLGSSSFGHPSCVTSSIVLPSNPQQIATGTAQLSDVSVWLNAQGILNVGAEDRVMIVNPYTNVGYLLTTLHSSGQLNGGETAQLVLYNSGSLPAPLVGAAQFTSPGTLLPSIQSGTTTNPGGTLTGGVS
jgi:hypothetical protein